jgi:hypothetical protein
MKASKQTIALALAGLFTGFSPVAHADTLAKIKGGDFAELSSWIPLAIFFVAAIFVYLCNRPRRVLVCARSRRRTELPRDTGR